VVDVIVRVLNVKRWITQKDLETFWSRKNNRFHFVLIIFLNLKWFLLELIWTWNWVLWRYNVFFKVMATFMFNSSLILVFLRITTYTHIFQYTHIIGYMKLIYNKPAQYSGHDIIVTHHVTLKG
jgi:hypothetical protein